MCLLGYHSAAIRKVAAFVLPSNSLLNLFTHADPVVDYIMQTNIELSKNEHTKIQHTRIHSSNQTEMQVVDIRYILFGTHYHRPVGRPGAFSFRALVI